MRPTPLLPVLMYWLPVNSCVRQVLPVRVPMSVTKTKNTKVYQRMEPALDYRVEEVYHHNDPIYVESKVILKQNDGTHMNETVRVFSTAHLQYAMQVNHQEPVTYTGILCNVGPLWTPAMTRFASVWFCSTTPTL